jgi:hypothetical protein
MFEYLGLALIILSWIAGGYILTKWRGTNAMSISQHAASSKRSSLIFAAVLSGAGVLFYYWLMAWFVPELGLGKLFVVLLTFAFIGQFVAGLVPDALSDVSGVKRRVHRVAAYGMAYLFVPLSLLILMAPHASGFGRYFGIVCLAYLICGWLLISFVPGSRKHYLVFQVVYVVAFQLQILITIYTMA